MPVMSDVTAIPNYRRIARVADAPVPVPSDAAGPTTFPSSVADAADSAPTNASPTFENTGDPLLLIGRRGGRRRRDDRCVSFHLGDFQ